MESAAICVEGGEGGQPTRPSTEHLCRDGQDSDCAGCLRSGESGDWKTGLEEDVHSTFFSPTET